MKRYSLVALAVVATLAGCTPQQPNQNQEKRLSK